MGLIQPDLVYRDVARVVFAEVAADPTLLDDVFIGRPDAELEEIRTYFAGSDVSVMLGWPREAPHAPSVSVILKSQGEDRQLVGSSWPTEASDDPDTVKDRIGSFFRGTVGGMVWSTNADLTAWASSILQWGLLRHRLEMGSAGLKEQSISMSDFMPVPAWFPSFAFGREVALQAEMPVSVLSAWPKIKEIDVTGREAGTQVSLTAVVRR